MTKYKVKLRVMSSDTVTVEAETEAEALEKAMEECKETFDCFYDSEIEKIEGGQEEGE